MDIGHQMARSQDVATKVAVLFKKRTQIAQQQFTESGDAIDAANALKIGDEREDGEAIVRRPPR